MLGNELHQTVGHRCRLVDRHGDVEVAAHPFDHDVWMMRANSPILRVVILPPAIRHRLHFFIYDGVNDGAYAPKARAFVRQLARYGVPSYWDSRVTEPTGVLYHTWTYCRESARDALIRLSALFLAERAQTD